VPEPTLAFKGKGAELFSIQIVNIALMVVTLGLYYPWAKAKKLQYLYRKLELAGSPFTFHGTGQEMFRGFLKGLGILAMLYGIWFLGIMSQEPAVMGICTLVFVAGLGVLIPVAMHGMMRYRLARTSWRGIHMGYRGTASDLLQVYFLNLFLTVVTFGLYGSWLTVNLRKEIIGNIRFGNARFEYLGEGSALFWLHLKGFLLTIVTCGVYAFWYTKDLLAFYIDNILVEQEGAYSRLQSHVTGWDYMKLTVVNMLLLVCTFGLGYAWVVTRTLTLVVSKSTIEGPFNPDRLLQTEKEYRDATYEDIADMMDIGLV